jgi:hypothetical protein
MALVHYRFETRRIEETKRMAAPKVATINAWYKQARTVIPQLPDLKRSDWQIFHHNASTGRIYIEIRNSVDERAYLVIDRTVPAIG